MKHVVVCEKIKHVGVSGKIHRMRRRLAAEKALEIIRRLDEDVAHQGAEFAMEVHRALIIAIGSRMARGTTTGRAVGVLSAVGAGLAPAYVKGVSRAHAEAEAIFAKPVRA